MIAGSVGKQLRHAQGLVCALLVVGSTSAAPVSVEWWNFDGALYDSRGQSIAGRRCLFQLVFDTDGNTDVSSMVSNRFWQIGGEHPDTGRYHADDDATFPDQNGYWEFVEDLGAWLVYVTGSYDGMAWGNRRFYFRFFNADSMASATEAGLIWNRNGQWRTAEDSDPPSPSQAIADLGRQGEQQDSLGGSVDGLHEDGWATMERAEYYCLTIVSEHEGVTPPPGAYVISAASGIVCSVLNPVQYVGQNATQYVCVGWSGTGCISNGSNATVTVKLTADSSLVWLWRTNYWLTISTQGVGQVEATCGWIMAGQTVDLLAIAGPYHHFDRWSGGVSSTVAQLSLPMAGPLWVHAVFCPEKTGDGVPYWWLAAHGLTNRGWDVESQEDQDCDQMATREEWVAGSDPTNAASVLRVTSVFVEGTGEEALQWFGASSRFYRVERCVSIGGQWEAVSGALQTTGEWSRMEWRSAHPTERSNSFFRVRSTLVNN